MIRSRHWARVVIPPDLGRMRIAQNAARNIAHACGFDESRLGLVELAIEEVVGTILRFLTQDDDLDDAEIHVRIEVEPPLLQLRIVNQGLPFDLSRIPDYDTAHLETDDCLAGISDGAAGESLDAGLPLFLLKRSVDRYRISNGGKEGIVFELAWFLPARHIAEQGEDTSFAGDERASKGGGTTSVPRTEPPEVVTDIRKLGDADAASLCRLVYRSYGNTYANEDLYFPDRVLALKRSGRIMSWGALTASGRLVGHLALMKDEVSAASIEWGMAVVDPLWRSVGLMKKMLAAAIESMKQRPETVMFAHAVTSHPFTQKTCHDYGFWPTALLFGFIPETRFRGIREQPAQRESIFLEARLMRPMPRLQLYPPPWHAATIRRILEHFGLSLHELAAGPTKVDGPVAKGEVSATTTTVSSTTIIRALNIGTIDVTRVGPDFRRVLSQEQRRLFRERVDMVYVTFDLTDPEVTAGVRAAEESGFFLGGLMPMQPFPYGLILQYPNTLKVDFQAVTTDSDQAAWLKETVSRERERIEEMT